MLSGSVDGAAGLVRILMGGGSTCRARPRSTPRRRPRASVGRDARRRPGPGHAGVPKAPGGTLPAYLAVAHPVPRGRRIDQDPTTLEAP